MNSTSLYQLLITSNFAFCPKRFLHSKGLKNAICLWLRLWKSSENEQCSTMKWSLMRFSFIFLKIHPLKQTKISSILSPYILRMHLFSKINDAMCDLAAGFLFKEDQFPPLSRYCEKRPDTGTAMKRVRFIKIQWMCETWWICVT